MQRDIMKELLKWKEDSNRKPLIVRGARQVGKTYSILAFGEEHYTKTVYFNFDKDERLKQVFEDTKDPFKILERLSFLQGEKIEAENTLIVFDEIQECPNALNSLKYFEEEAKEYHIICAGSLLGIRLSQTSFPVGKVDYLNMYPMTFLEFLEACGYTQMTKYIRHLSVVQEVPATYFQTIYEQLKIYLVVGGMPEVVNSWASERDIGKVKKIQDAILKDYEGDFAKHTSTEVANKISLIWNNVPSQVSKENKKFLYSALKPGARAREYEDALNWLYNANLIQKIYNIQKPAFPLKAYDDLTSFKIYLLDVGLLRKISRSRK